jgi:hypothetical protein
MVGCLFYLASYAGLAQSSLFSKVIYDSQNNVQAYCCYKTLDNKFIIAGEENNNAFASKIDTTGAIIWSKTLGSNMGAFYSLVATRDSCFVLAGFAKNTGDTASDILCVKLNSSGDTVWTRMIDMGFQDKATSIRQTIDNGFILTGNSSGGKIAVVKLDGFGTLSWGKLYSVAGYENFGCGVSQTSDTGFIVTGYLESSTTYVQTMYLMKMTSTGIVSWMKTLNYPYSSMGYDVLAIPGWVITYLTVNTDIVLMNTSLSGNLSWSKSYTANSYQSASPSYKLHRTTEGGYFFVTGQPMGESMIRVDANGNLLSSWSLVSIPADVVEDGGDFFIVGNGPIIGTKQYQNSNPQVGVINADSSGSGSSCVSQGNVVASNYSATFANATCTSQTAGTVKYLSGPVISPTMTIMDGCVSILGGINELKPSISIHVFPNPNDGVFNITAGEAGQNEVQLVEVFNILGERIYVSSDPSVLLSPINIGRVQDGVYDVKVSFKTTTCSQQILICH